MTWSWRFGRADAYRMAMVRVANGLITGASGSGSARCAQRCVLIACLGLVGVVQATVLEAAPRASKVASQPRPCRSSAEWYPYLPTRLQGATAGHRLPDFSPPPAAATVRRRLVPLYGWKGTRRDRAVASGRQAGRQRSSDRGIASEPDASAEGYPEPERGISLPAHPDTDTKGTPRSKHIPKPRDRFRLLEQRPEIIFGGLEPPAAGH